MVNKAISNLTRRPTTWSSRHQDLTDRARQKTGSAVHVSVDNFMNSPRYDEIVELLEQGNGAGARRAAAARGRAADAGRAAAGLLDRESIVLDGAGDSRDDGDHRGRASCWWRPAPSTRRTSTRCTTREQSVSTYMGNLLAIPHGTNEAKPSIRQTAISFVRYPDGVDWNGKEVKFVVGIAGAGNDHLKLLGQIAEVFLDSEQVARLEAATTADEVLARPGRGAAAGLTPTARRGPAPAQRSRSRAAVHGGDEHHHDERRAQQQRDHGHAQPGQPGVDHQVRAGHRGPRTPAPPISAASSATGIRSATRSTTGCSSTFGGTESPASLSR